MYSEGMRLDIELNDRRGKRLVAPYREFEEMGKWHRN